MSSDVVALVTDRNSSGKSFYADFLFLLIQIQ